MKNINVIVSMLIVILALPTVTATMSLDNIQFDPAIIASGDTVDIVIQFSASRSQTDVDRIDDPDYKFKVSITPDDDISKEFVTILDGAGDDLFGTVYSGEKYNKKFRVKISPNAPAGDYEFKMTGQWYKDDEVENSIVQYVKFTMPVKKEGIILGISQLTTVPAEVRSGDEYVKVLANIENSGQKDAKAVEIKAIMPEGLEASYTDNNRMWVGYVGAGESKQVTFYIDVDENLAPGVQNIRYSMEFMDIDNNIYQKSEELPFRIKPRPYLEIVESMGAGVAGDSSKLSVVVKNTGLESAEAVEVRIIKQSAQPFNLDVRSDYLGELEPGEEATAIFNIDVGRDAEMKEYSLKLLIRSKGDSDEGDDNIYTYTRRATFDVTGKATNYLLYIGIILLAIIIIGIGIRGLRK